jgi:DNA sulfur modification protein DndC
MEALIDHGEEWMIPMLEFRDFLAATQDPARRQEVRDYRRRDGMVHYRKRGQGELLIRGPYRLEFRKELLTRLLQVQTQVQRAKPELELELISPDELYEIRRLWRVEAQDWEDALPAIYRAATGQDLAWPQEDGARFGADERALLAQICAEEELPLELMLALIESQRQHGALSGRTRIHARIDEVLRSEWRDEQAVIAAVAAHHQRITGDAAAAAEGA